MNTFTQIKKPVVVVADPLHEVGLQALRTWSQLVYVPDRQWAGAERVADALVVRAPVNISDLEAMPKLRAIVRCGAGLDGVPLEYTSRRGIATRNTPGANAQAVAEYVFASALTAARKLSEFSQQLRDGDWHCRLKARSESFELTGRRLGILGMGEVGQRVARIGRLGFNMQVQASVATPRSLPEGIETVDIETLFRSSDIVTLCCSLSDATKGIVNESLLYSLRPHSILINVSRGAVIESSALEKFVRDQSRTTALMLDVHHTSPLPESASEKRAHLCWPTPHLAALTVDSELRMGLATDKALVELLGVKLVEAFPTGS